MSFIQKLTHTVEKNNSLLCVGLDPNPQKYPRHFPTEIDRAALVAWGTRLIQQTADLVCCYKPNFAFYEQYGPAGLEALRQTIAAVPDDIPVLLDAKRGDIGSTAAAYARAAFDVWGADAVTVNPYLGQDSIAPFVAHRGKTVFVLCYTSNPSARMVQEFGDGDPLFEHIARQAQTWGNDDQIAFVIGATQPHALRRFRQVTAGRRPWILARGVGAQGGNLAGALSAGLDDRGLGMIVPVSRAIIYATDPRAAAQALRDNINRVRQSLTKTPASVPHTDLILGLHDVGCVQFGQFTLASGRTSPIYIDLRRLSASPVLLKRAARAYASLLKNLIFDHIAGVPYAALPIGTAVALALGKPLIYPRKEVKSHGTGKLVEGVFSAGDTAVVIEDLVTSGGSVLKAAATLRKAGLVVTDVAVLIDRQQGGADNLAAAGFRLHAALTIGEILSVLREAGRITSTDDETVRAYLRG